MKEFLLALMTVAWLIEFFRSHDCVALTGFYGSLILLRLEYQHAKDR